MPCAITNSVDRNHMKAMKKGDIAFFYHSNCKEPGIAGTMEIVREASADGLFESCYTAASIDADF